MRKLIITATLLALGIAAHGQVTTPQVRDTATDPTGVACTSAARILRYTGTNIYFGCGAGNVYVAFSAASASYLPLTGGTLTGALNGTSVALPSIIQGQPQALASSAWKRYGQLFSSAGEPTVLYETPALLIATSQAVFKMWYDCNLGTCYAESLTALPGSWTVQGTAAATGYLGNCVKHYGATYYYFGVPADRSHIDVLTSTTGATFSSPTTILTPGTAGTWDASSISTSSAYFDGTTWRVLYQGANSGSGTDNDNVWRMGLATGTSLATLTKSASNPVITPANGPGGAITGGVADYIDGSGNIWIWPQGSTVAGTNSPTQIYRMSSSDWIHWTLTPSLSVLPRLTAQEGAGNLQGQNADASLVEANGSVYMFYSADANSVTAQVSLAVAPLTLSQLVQTDEGASSGYPQPSFGYKNDLLAYGLLGVGTSDTGVFVYSPDRQNLVIGTTTSATNGTTPYTTLGARNTGVGAAIQSVLTSGSDNSAFGFNAQTAMTSGTTNSAYGNYSQTAATTATANTANGYASQHGLTTGAYNTAVGGSSQYGLTAQSGNSAFGYNTQYNNSTGISDDAFGSQSQQSITSGNYNSSFGQTSQIFLTTGGGNAAFGFQSEYNLISGNYNSGFGANSLENLTTGSTNSAFGNGAGMFIADGTTPNQTSATSVYVGANTKAKADGDTNEIVIGESAIGQGSNTATVGTSSITQFCFSGSTICWFKGSGVPPAGLCVSGNVGSLYSNTSGGTSTTLYVCTAAATWTAK